MKVQARNFTPLDCHKEENLLRHILCSSSNAGAKAIILDIGVPADFIARRKLC